MTTKVPASALQCIPATISMHSSLFNLKMAAKRFFFFFVRYQMSQRLRLKSHLVNLSDVCYYFEACHFFQQTTSLNLDWWKYSTLTESTYCIKQFLVTNCLFVTTNEYKNRILIPIVTSKESNFNADFKYISFIKISLTNQKLRAWEHLPYFRKQRKPPPNIHRILTKITSSDSAYQRTLL